MTQLDKTYILLRPEEFLSEKTSKRTGVFYFYKTRNYTWDYDVIIIYLIDGKYHREDGPAYINKPKSDKDKNNHEMWFINNKAHRIDGFASSHGEHGWFYINDVLLVGKEDSVALKLLDDKEKLKNYLTLLSLKYA